MQEFNSALAMQLKFDFHLRWVAKVYPVLLALTYSGWSFATAWDFAQTSAMPESVKTIESTETREEVEAFVYQGLKQRYQAIHGHPAAEGLIERRLSEFRLEQFEKIRRSLKKQKFDRIDLLLK